MNSKDFWAKRLYEFSVGKHLGYTNIHFGIQLALLLAIYTKMMFGEMNKWVYIIVAGSLTILYILIWLFGYICIKSGFYERFQLRGPFEKRVLREVKKEEV